MWTSGRGSKLWRGGWEFGGRNAGGNGVLRGRQARKGRLKQIGWSNKDWNQNWISATLTSYHWSCSPTPTASPTPYSTLSHHSSPSSPIAPIAGTLPSTLSPRPTTTIIWTVPPSSIYMQVWSLIGSCWPSAFPLCLPSYALALEQPYCSSKIPS